VKRKHEKSKGKRGKEHKEPNIPLHFQGVTAAV